MIQECRGCIHGTNGDNLLDHCTSGHNGYLESLTTANECEYFEAGQNQIYRTLRHGGECDYCGAVDTLHGLDGVDGKLCFTCLEYALGVHGENHRLSFRK